MLNSRPQQAAFAAGSIPRDVLAHDTPDDGAVTHAHVTANDVPQGGDDPPSTRHHVDRGLTTVVAPLLLQDAIRYKALCAANRFRVTRTFDVAAVCFPERPYKAALTAAQRAMRGLVKDGLLLRYRTDRQQHVYGLTQRGAQWLEDHGVEASSSVRRVSEMTNPEHLLWASFIVVCCEARGLVALTEAELLQALANSARKGQKAIQGLLRVDLSVGGRAEPRLLRPDAIAYEADGGTWFEIDRSKRGQGREAALAALFARVGAPMLDQRKLTRVVVLAKTERILQRALAIARKSVKPVAELRMGPKNGRAFRQVAEGVFEVWAEVPGAGGRDRSGLEPALVGHVVIQMLPLWLPKFRIDARNVHSTEGWFPENYLPYRRAPASSAWSAPTSPLRGTTTKAA